MSTLAGSQTFREAYVEGDRREIQLPGRGLKCAGCGALLPKVYRTITTAGFITRERICPQCDKVNTTGERVLNVRERKGGFHEPCE